MGRCGAVASVCFGISFNDLKVHMATARFLAEQLKAFPCSPSKNFEALVGMLRGLAHFHQPGDTQMGVHVHRC